MNQGTSLVELILVIALFFFIVVLVAAIPNSISLITQARHQSLAAEIAIKGSEDLRSLQFNNIPTTGGEDVIDPRLKLLPDGSAKRFISLCDISICQSTEQNQIKEVVVKVKWSELGSAKEVSITTFIGEGGINQ